MAASTSSSGDLSLPPIAALFLTVFDDIKGQSVVYYSTIDDQTLAAGQIEHTTLPSGLHLLESDHILFTHGTGSLSGIGLFRNVPTLETERGRGRKMGTLGVIFACKEPALGADPGVHEALGAMYDALGGTFDAGAVKGILDTYWATYRAKTLEDSASVSGRTKAERVLGYLPDLLEILGPSLATVYKYAITGKRILIYSAPPLYPVGLYAYLIALFSTPPSSAPGPGRGHEWLGNIGLMDLDSVKKRRGGWVATTSDSIYRSHTSTYDLYIDLSPAGPTSPTPPSSSASPSSSTEPVTAGFTPLPSATLHIPSTTRGETQVITYAFADIPLYRSLLSSEPSHPIELSRGGIWVTAYALWERIWKLCVGVCDYAIGRGELRLEEGEEDARLLDNAAAADAGERDELDTERDSGDEDEGGGESEGKEEWRRRSEGRRILRQLHHHSYHLAQLLRGVTRGRKGETISEPEVRDLTGKRWSWGSVADSAEGRFWQDLSREWGFTEEH